MLFLRSYVHNSFLSNDNSGYTEFTVVILYLLIMTIVFPTIKLAFLENTRLANIHNIVLPLKPFSSYTTSHDGIPPHIQHGEAFHVSLSLISDIFSSPVRNYNLEALPSFL